MNLSDNTLVAPCASKASLPTQADCLGVDAMSTQDPGEIPGTRHQLQTMNTETLTLNQAVILGSPSAILECLCVTPPAPAPVEPKPKTAYENALDDLQRKMDELDAIKPHLEMAERIVAEFPAMNAEVQFWDGCGLACINLYASDLKEVVPMLTAIVKSGYRAEGFHDYYGKGEGNGRRLYDYRRDNGRISVNVHLVGKETQCHFRQVGVREVPVMELVCS